WFSGHKRGVFQRCCAVDALEKLRKKNCNGYFQSLTRMHIHEFEVLVEELKHLNKEKISNTGVKFYFENKVLFFFIWTVKNVDYSVLSFLFGTSITVLSVLIETL